MHKYRIVSLFLVFLIFGCDPVHNPPSDPPPGPSLDELKEKVIAWYPIGRSSSDISDRQVKRSTLNPEGWQNFVDETVLPQITEKGIERVMLHNPFGTLPSNVEPYQFDQYLDAKKANLSWLTEGFAEAWTPVVESGIEVIGYIGSPYLDNNSQQYINQNGIEAWKSDIAYPSIEPLMNAGMSIAFDAAAASPNNSPTYNFVNELRTDGVQTYIEANPRKDHSWWFDSNVIVIDDTWRDRLPDPNFSDSTDITGEIVRIIRLDLYWVRTHPKGLWPQAACRAIAQGHSVLLRDNLLRSSKRTLEGLSECVGQFY